MRLDQAWGGTPQYGAGERSTIGQTQPVDFASFRLSDRRPDEVRLARRCALGHAQGLYGRRDGGSRHRAERGSEVCNHPFRGTGITAYLITA